MTWKSLVEVLESSFVNEQGLAERLLTGQMQTTCMWHGYIPAVYHVNGDLHRVCQRRPCTKVHI